MKIFSLPIILTVGLFLQACGGGGGSSLTPSSTAATSSVAQSSSLTSSSMSSSSATSKNPNFAKGADVSWITEMEDEGKKFFNKAGVEKDLFDILKEQGMDSIRLRVWVNPADGTYSNMTDVLAKAKRAKAAGMKLMIDFHYSDKWADPGQQTKPAAWNNFTVDELAAAVATHTRDSLQILKDADINPVWVQVGNETNDGMLWPEGRATLNMANYARFVASGYDAVKAIFPQTLVIVHVSDCFNGDLFKWNIGGIKANGGKFDVIGASNYPISRPKTEMGATVPWQTTHTECLANLNDMVTTFNVPVMVVEMGTPMTQSDAKSIIADMISKVRSIKDDKGLGVLYWEPQAYGGWKGYGLGAFDDTGKPTAAMDAFLE